MKGQFEVIIEILIYNTQDIYTQMFFNCSYINYYARQYNAILHENVQEFPSAAAYKYHEKLASQYSTLSLIVNGSLDSRSSVFGVQPQFFISSTEKG